METSRTSDADLVVAARLGDTAAFAELVARHQKMTMAVCWPLAGSNDSLWDVLQEAILVAFTGLERLVLPQRFGSWLCGIALNVARGARSQRPLVSGLPSDVAEWPDPTRGPDEKAVVSVLASEVREAVAELAPGQRAAVLLFYMQGM